MTGPFIASSQGAPCHLCGGNIAAGSPVFYLGPRLDDSKRTCDKCIVLDLFGSPQ